MSRATSGLPSSGGTAAAAAQAARERGDLEEARRLLDAAVAEDPSYSNLLSRAAVLSDLGYVLEAIVDAGAASKLSPDDPTPFLLSAQYHLQRRNYPEAKAHLDAAIALDPRNPASRLRRAELYTLSEAPEAAVAELETAVKDFPDDEIVLLALLTVLVVYGLSAKAGALIKRLLRSGSPRAKLEAKFSRACLDARLRRPGCGEKDFKAVMRALPEDDHLSLRARHYWIATRPLDQKFLKRIGMKKTKKPKLYMVGLGMFPPYNASLDVLMAISRCDLVFNNVAGPEVRNLVATFCGDVRRASYQAWQDEPKWANAMFKELEKGHTVGFVTRGHPLVFGGLARELVRRCRAEGVEFECLASVSSIDHFLAVTGTCLGEDIGGISAVDLPAFERQTVHSTRIPLILCFYGGVKDKAGIRAVSDSLKRFYPGELECWMFGPKYDSTPATVRIDDLDKKYSEFHSSLMLYVPALLAPAAVR
ncbi:MAG: SAM-dependent methyltransferase [Elusimicrobiota bacterium]